MFIRKYLKNEAIKRIIYAVINLSPETCMKIKAARRDAGLSQSALAAEVGCKQSALSMFEQGDGTKLGDEIVKKIAAKFGIEIEDRKEETRSLPDSVIWRRPGTAFCPNPECPGNSQYKVGSLKYYRPDRSAQDPAGGRFCAICGEVLETRCPECGAEIHEGAVCTFCGKPYISAVGE